MTGADFGALLIVGIFASAIMQFIKDSIPGKTTKILTVAGISIVLATIYYLVRDTAYWQTALTIFGWAGAVYAYFFEHVENK